LGGCGDGVPFLPIVQKAAQYWVKFNIRNDVKLLRFSNKITVAFAFKLWQGG
jgi:hypothetical protein